MIQQYSARSRMLQGNSLERNVDSDLQYILYDTHEHLFQRKWLYGMQSINSEESEVLPNLQIVVEALKGTVLVYDNCTALDHE